MSERVLVCGGRDYADTDRVWSVLDDLLVRGELDEIIHGGADGADRLADNWAFARRIPVRMFPADWKQHGTAAGPIRNQQMIDEGKPALVIGFPGGRGTADMVRRARDAGVRVMEITA
jgi:hypothetical protein